MIISIEMLDGKQITENSRQFLMSWKASREAQLLREKSKGDLGDNEMDDFNNGGKSHRYRIRILLIKTENWNYIYIYIISFYLSPKYSLYYHTSAINDIVPSNRSVHSLSYRV
jgi:hypothetical protein